MNERDAILAKVILDNMTEEQKNQSYEIYQGYKKKAQELTHAAMFGDKDLNWWPCIHVTFSLTNNVVVKNFKSVPQTHDKDNSQSVS